MNATKVLKGINTIANLCLSVLAGVCVGKGINEKDSTKITIGTMAFVVSQTNNLLWNKLKD